MDTCLQRSRSSLRRRGTPSSLTASRLSASRSSRRGKPTTQPQPHSLPRSRHTNTSLHLVSSLVAVEATYSVANNKTESGEYTTQVLLKHRSIDVLKKPYKEADESS